MCAVHLTYCFVYKVNVRSNVIFAVFMALLKVIFCAIIFITRIRFSSARKTKLHVKHRTPAYKRSWIKLRSAIFAKAPGKGRRISWRPLRLRHSKHRRKYVTGLPISFLNIFFPSRTDLIKLCGI